MHEDDQIGDRDKRERSPAEVPGPFNGSCQQKPGDRPDEEHVGQQQLAAKDPVRALHRSRLVPSAFRGNTPIRGTRGGARMLGNASPILGQDIEVPGAIACTADVPGAAGGADSTLAL